MAGLTRERKVAEARVLREQGLSYRAIGARFGVTHSAVAKWLNPERAKGYNRRDNANRAVARREWERSNRAACPRCGVPMRMGSACPSHRSARCVNCYRADQRAMGDATFRKLEVLWLAGKKFPEVQAAMGWSKGTLSAMLDRGRKRGYDLPHRRHGEALENIRRAHRERAAA